MTATDDLQAAWIAFCDDLKGAVDHVVDPTREVADGERAEGVRHALRMLSMQIGQVFENEDALHPELGWVYPAKMGQDNPDALYQTAPMDLHNTYRLSGNVGSVRSLGFAVRPTTINDSQAVLDDDGVCRLVISPEDPGVSNWLDTAGTADGYITYRYNLAETEPGPTLSLLSMADLADHLPDGTATITPAERAALQRERRRHALRRFRR